MQMSKVWERGWHLRWQWTWWSRSCHASLGEGRSLLSTGGQGRCGSQGEVRVESTESCLMCHACAMLVPCLCHACASSSWKWPELERSQGSAILRAALNSIDIIQKHPETSRNIQSYTTAAVKFSVCWMTWELLWHCDTVSCVQCPWGKVIWMAQSPPMRCTTARHMWHRTS